MLDAVKERLYCLAFVVLLVVGVGMRGVWIYMMQVPFSQSDSITYIQPIVQDALFPMSPVRTGGTSIFVSLALVTFGGTIGILIVNGVLAVVSGVLLALAIKTVLQQHVFSLIALYWTLFAEKNVTFEYFLMSEHYARCLYVLYAALALWVFQQPRRYWLVVILSLIVALNILVKPSAVILIFATLLAFGFAALLRPSVRGHLIPMTVIFVGLVALPMLGYMSVFNARYGSFSLTQMEGYNQFSHIGHLTVLEGGRHPILKDRLRPLIGPYAANYASKGNYQPNWLIYDEAITDELRRDFGNEHPSIIIRKYAREFFGSDAPRIVNQIQRDLAIEALFGRPIEYLTYAAERGYALWNEGFYHSYYKILPGPSQLQRHREDRIDQRKWLYWIYGAPMPLCEDGPIVPARASGVAVLLFSGPFASCRPLPYDRVAVAKLGDTIDALYQTMIWPLAAVHSILPYAGAVAFVVGGLMFGFVGGRDAMNLYGFGLLLLLVLFGYTAFHGLVNVAEPQRMTVNVQDYVVIGSWAFILCSLLQLHRLLALLWSRRFRIHMSST